MMIVQLTSSRFYGGPERQILGLARALSESCCTTILSFAEGGHCREFIDEAHRQGIAAAALEHDTPHLWAALDELTERLRDLKAAVVCCHAYKADLLGRWAARRLGIPVVAVSRGWTGESWKVRLYEAIDRRVLRGMDRVVCVSQAQAAKVAAVGVPTNRINVIANAIDLERFADPDPRYHAKLQALFPTPKRRIVGSAGRLSPEKGYQVLLPAAAEVVRRDPSVGFVWFGDGPLRDRLAAGIAEHGLSEHVILAGFRKDLDRYLPFLDLLVLPSFTEGMPNVVLEAMAAAVPVVATAVGGTPEVVEESCTGYLVPAGAPEALAERLKVVLGSETERQAMGQRGRKRVEACFGFAAQSRQYRALFRQLALADETGSVQQRSRARERMGCPA